MDATKLPKKIPNRLRIIIGIIIIIVVIVIAVLSMTGEDKINTNQSVVVSNNNAVNTNTTNANAANTNTNQVVAEDETNTNQTSADANDNSNQAANTNTQQVVVSTAKTIDDTAIQLVPKQTGYCEALAPSDWSFVSNAEATGADLLSPDQSQHSGWGISGVYTYMYPDVDSFLTTWLGYAFTGSFDTGNITLGSSQELEGGFIQRDFTTVTGRTGVAIYKTYNFGDPTMYVVSVYMADTTNDIWLPNGALPFSVAVSIRCVSQLRPTTSSVDVSTADPSSSSDNPEVSLSDQWTEAIMGFENVYSPSTGEHYEAPLNSKWETGPEGSGYYRSLPGGGYEKLERGFGDY